MAATAEKVGSASMTIEELEQTTRDYRRRETQTATDFETQIFTLTTQLSSQKMAFSQSKYNSVCEDS